MDKVKPVYPLNFVGWGYNHSEKLQATYRVTKCGVESLRVLLKFLVWEGFPIFVNQVVGSVNNTAIHLVCGWKET